MEIVPAFNNVHLDPDDVLRRFGLQPHGPVQTTIDNSVMRYMEPYWAHGDTGELAVSCYAATDAGSGLIVYPGPYAHYMYMGDVYGPNYPVEIDSEGNVLQWRSRPGKGSNHYMGRKFGDLVDKYPQLKGYSKEKSKLAGANPLGRMKADHLNDILEEARAVARDQQR